MSGSQYRSSNNSSLFSVEDSIDDDEFLRHPQSGKSGYMMGNDSLHTNNLHDVHQQRLDKQREIQSKILETSQRSLSLLRNSEEIGVSTAEELLRQREQLERTEKRLDEINSTLKFSQKHIQGIKSVFGSFKNYLSGKSESGEPTASAVSTVGVSNASSTLADAVVRTKPFAEASSQSHPGLRLRGLEPERSYNPTRQADPEHQISENLNEMASSITRLKGLAQGLGEEMDSQNDLVENIIGKTERADISMQRQNKDMSRLLKR